MYAEPTYDIIIYYFKLNITPVEIGFVLGLSPQYVINILDNEVKQINALRNKVKRNGYYKRIKK